VPPQLIQDDDASRSYHEGLRELSSELAAGMVVDDDLGLLYPFVAGAAEGVDLTQAPHLLEDHGPMLEHAVHLGFSRTHPSTADHLHQREQQPRLCTIQVKKGQTVSTDAAPLILVPSGLPSKQKRRQMTHSTKEKRAKCR